jgi:hypothetical protein
MDPLELLHWATLTSTIQNIKTPNNFLRRLLFSNDEPVSTETIEIGMWEGEREIAPFVEVNGEALSVSGYNEVFQTVKAPNIRIKRPMKASEAMFKRRPGTTVFTTRETQVSEIERLVALDQRRLRELTENTIEYMIALAMQGAISYQVPGEANFKITYPRKSTHDLTVTGAWSGTPNIGRDFTNAARLINEDAGLGMTHAIMSKEAAENFIDDSDVQARLDNRNYDVGGLTIRSQFEDSGARYIGRFQQIDCWEYPRSVLVNGSSVDLIREGYVEFVAATPAAENVVYYGAIPDIDAMENGTFQGTYFSKSWKTEDPSVRWLLAQSRPLPVPRRFDSMVSLDTTP